MAELEFTAHNILLDNGEFTKPEGILTAQQHWMLSFKKVLDLVFPKNRKIYRVVDLGCLEGGYSVEIARMGFDTVGIEARDANYNCCAFVKENVDLPNLQFIKDDVRNVADYGPFDAAFCCGLLYHLDKPKEFLETLSQQTKTLLYIQTHFSTELHKSKQFILSQLAENEGLTGRWYGEHPEHSTLEEHEAHRWASYRNNASFWIKREHLIATIYRLGFNIVFEQFDYLGDNMLTKLETEYDEHLRGTFVGIRV